MRLTPESDGNCGPVKHATLISEKLFLSKQMPKSARHFEMPSSDCQGDTECGPVQTGRIGTVPMDDANLKELLRDTSNRQFLARALGKPGRS
jgi:hypothetical protein